MSYLDSTLAVFPFDNALQAIDLNPVYIPPDPIEILIEMTVYNTDSSAVEVLRYCTGTGVVVGGNFYEPRIKNPGSILNLIFAQGKTSGPSELGYGIAELDNTDGGLDPLIKYGYGRPIVFKQLIAGAAVLLMSCSTEQPTFVGDVASIRIKDPSAVLNVPIQTNKYAGTNSLPNGVEGTANIQGKEKPLLEGSVSNATPICVNTAKLEFQVNDGAVNSTGLNVYDKSVLITRGADYTSVADMEANAPAELTVRWYPAGGYFRLGSSPIGQVTFDAVAGATAADRTAAQIAKRMALRVLTAGDLVTQDFTDLDAVNSAEVGIYITSTTTVAAAMSEVLDSIGGWYAFDSANKLNVGRLEAPSGTPAVSLSDIEINSLDRVETQDEGGGVPVWQVNLNYGKNYTVQDAGSLSGSVFENWDQSNLPSTSTWSKGVFGNGLFIAFTQVWPNIYYVTSPDGTTWTQGNPGPLYVPEGVTYGNGIFLAIHKYNSSYGWVTASKSTDGRNWVAATGPAGVPSDGTVMSMVYGNGIFVAIGYGGYDSATGKDTSYSLVSADNGANWGKTVLTVGPGTFLSPGYKAVSYGNGLFVAVGDGGRVATSPDGATWTPRTSGNTYNWIKATYGNGLFVAMTAGSNVTMTSPDGMNWTVQNILVTSITWTAIGFGDGKFVMVGSASKFVLVSDDGISWKIKAIPSTQTFNSVTYGNGRFMLFGNSSNTTTGWSVALNGARAQFLSKEFRTVTASDATVKTVHPLSPPITINTLLVSQTAAQAEADRQLAMRKVHRDYFQVKLPASAVTAIPDMGKVVNITYPRYGCDTGKDLRMLGYETHLETDDLTLYLWG